MRYLLLGLLFFSLSIQAATAQIHNYPPPAFMLPRHYQSPRADCAIFPAAAAVDAPLDSPSLGRFTPTSQQIDSAEQALATVELSRINAEAEPAGYSDYPRLIKKQLPQYKRQYFGYYNLMNHPCLYIVFAIVQPTDTSWLKASYRVFDAGPDYWTVRYNLATKTFYAFEHSGQ